MRDKKENLAYRPCVGIALFNSEDKVFVGERIDTPGAWQMPQGGIDPGESIEQTAIREVSEEVGVSEQNVSIIAVADQTIKYDLPDDMIPKLWNGQFRGQEQNWVAMRFLGHDTDINLNAHTPPEFRAWQWVALENTLDLIVPFKRETYRQVIELFSSRV